MGDRQLLGYGASARVYLDSRNGERVAVKEIPKDLISLIELDVLSRARSPYIMNALAVETSGPYLSVVMPLAEKDLGKGVDAKDRWRAAAEICKGVHDLHRYGIFHMDIKAENVLKMNSGRYVIADFGLATYWSPSTLSGVRYTATYRPPEWDNGEVYPERKGYTPSAIVDERSEVFALGCLIMKLMMNRSFIVHIGRGKFAIDHSLLDDAVLKTRGRDQELMKLVVRALSMELDKRPRMGDLIKLFRDSRFRYEEAEEAISTPCNEVIPLSTINKIFSLHGMTMETAALILDLTARLIPLHGEDAYVHAWVIATLVLGKDEETWMDPTKAPPKIVTKVLESIVDTVVFLKGQLYHNNIFTDAVGYDELMEAVNDLREGSRVVCKEGLKRVRVAEKYVTV